MLLVTRFILFLPCFLILILSLIKIRKSALIIFLTQWGNHLAVITTLLTIQAGREVNKDRKTLIRVTAILFEVTFVMQVIIVSIYWPLLHHLVLEKLKTEADSTFLYYHMIFIHSVPFISMLLNLTMSQIVFIPSHSIYLVAVGLLYCIVNYFGSLYRGHALYPFLPWTDFKSIIVCAVLLIISFILYQAVSFLISLAKTKPQRVKAE